MHRRWSGCGRDGVAVLRELSAFSRVSLTVHPDGGGVTTALRSRAPRSVHVEHVMSTVVSLDVRGVPGPAVEAAFDRMMAWLHAVDRRFSTYRHDSEISRIDRGELPVTAASRPI